jgi:peptidyl-prolyl cis-trans isomerase D|tara:strand:- start:1687 stop:3624 length:1938 start_codon:yes stop_codon:yes gene_type:complete
VGVLNTGPPSSAKGKGIMLIQQLRDGSDGILAKVIIGLIIIVFGLFGFGSITTFLAPVPKVATVNGEAVTQQAMEIAVERNRRLLQSRGVPLDQINEDELRENVLRGLVSREILTQATDEFDLYYSDALLDEEIISSEVFQVGGVFNADQFQNVIRGAGYTPLLYRDEMRTDSLFNQMLAGIRQSAFVTEAESKRYSSLLSQTRDLAYLQIRVDELIDEVSVSEEELGDYYTDRAGDFVTEETVNLQYVELKHEQLAAALEVDQEALEQFYQDNQGDYSTEESRRVAHILIEVSDDLSIEAAKIKASEVYGRINQGEDFTALALTDSDDAGSRDNGGDLGFNPQGTFFPEFEAVAYELSVDQVSEPVETEIGYHIIKLLELNEAVQPMLADIRVEVEQRYRLYATEDEFITTSSRLAELLFEAIDLEAPAAELGLEVQSTGDLTRESQNFLMVNNSVATAAFSADVLIDGNNSDLLELTDSHHVGIRVQAHSPSATRSLAEVASDVREILERGKAEALAVDRADSIVEAINGGSLAQYVSNEYGLEWAAAPSLSRFSRDIDPLVMREAFKLPRPGDDKESLGTAMLPNGDSLVLRVSEVTNRPSSELIEAEVASVRENLSLQLGSMDFQEFEDALTAEASIERVN